MGFEATVFLIDDDPGMRKSLRMVMESAGLNAEAYESAEAFFQARNGDEPGCILLDLRMPGIGGMAMLERVCANAVHTPVIIISGHGQVSDAVRAMKLGAADFVEKPVHPPDLIVKVQGAMAADQENRARHRQSAALRDRMAVLTPREMELLKHLVDGKSSKVIAREMGLSLKTVENHRSHLLAKTGALNSADLVRMSIVAGLA